MLIGSQPSVSSLSLEEDIIEELEDFWQLYEPKGDNCVDTDLVKDIIRKI